MNNDIPKKIIDITGVELSPGEPAVCLRGHQGTSPYRLIVCLVIFVRFTINRSCPCGQLLVFCLIF